MTKITFLLLGLFFLTGCGGVNPQEGTGESIGFFWGIWDGWTVFFAFIGKMFGADMNIYEVVNNGNWYNFGFLLGIGSWGILSW